MPKKNKILLVDDDSLISRMYQERFTRDGFDVVLAFNGKEGLEKAEKEKPDLILLDIMMPMMNGYETLKILKEKKATASIPVIMFSSLGPTPELMEKVKKLGVTDIVEKGGLVSDKDLVEKIKAILQKK